MARPDCKVSRYSWTELFFLYGLRAATTPRISFHAAMQIAKKQSTTSRTSRSATSPVDWSTAIVTRGGGVAATIAAIKRTRGPNKKPTKEQVAIRLDSDVLSAFRADGRGWQTRVNSALKEWLANHR
jgi:uncharacterized protein (DUF4415 family)